MKGESMTVVTGKEFLKLTGANTPEAQAKYRKLRHNMNRQAASGSRQLSKFKPAVIGPRPLRGDLDISMLKHGYNEKP